VRIASSSNGVGHVVDGRDVNLNVTNTETGRDLWATAEGDSFRECSLSLSLFLSYWRNKGTREKDTPDAIESTCFDVFLFFFLWALHYRARPSPPSKWQGRESETRRRPSIGMSDDWFFLGFDFQILLFG
jgi:hypothetical protein